MALWSRECPVCADIGWCNDHPIKDHDDMTTKPNEPEGMEPCPFCGSEAKIERSAISAVQLRCAECVCGTGLYADDQVGRRNAIAAWNRRAPAQPVADAGGVTDADREAAAKCVEHGLSRPNPLNVRQGVVDSWHLVQAFAAHRLQSVAAATAAKDAEIARLLEAIERALCCTPQIRSKRSQFHGVGETHKIVYDCGNPWEILRAALSEAREAGDSLAGGDRV